jgi:hypothetical protein
MNDKLSPCAADALSRVRLIGIEGKNVGIIRLDESISEVMALNLTGDEEIRSALLERISHHNIIPPSAGEAYAKALTAEFHADRMRRRMEQARENYSTMDTK